MYEYLAVYHNSQVKNLDIYGIVYIGSNIVRNTSMKNIGNAWNFICKLCHIIDACNAHVKHSAKLANNEILLLHMYIM